MSPNTKLSLQAITFIVVVLTFAIWLGMRYLPQGPGRVEHEVGWHSIVVIKLACRTQELTQSIERIRGSSDREAFNRAATDAITSGRCAVFNVGDEVNTVEVAMWAGMIQLRKRGDTVAYWTYLSAIDR